MYSTMSRANWIIQELVKKEKGTTLTAVEKRSLGEAYFSRGWAHYLIAYRYGTDKQGVPFVLRGLPRRLRQLHTASASYRYGQL